MHTHTVNLILLVENVQIISLYNYNKLYIEHALNYGSKQLFQVACDKQFVFLSHIIFAVSGDKWVFQHMYFELHFASFSNAVYKFFMGTNLS